MNYLAYIFITYLLGGVVLVSIRSRSHVEMDNIRRVLEESAMAPPPAVAAALLNQRVAEGRVSNLSEGPA